MYQCSLRFSCTADICSFISLAQVKNFLLLGKKSILIASLPASALRIARETYKACLVESPDLLQTRQIYFQKTVAESVGC